MDKDLAIKAATFFAGIFVALLSSHFVLAKELSFIKGQLAHLMRIHDMHSRLKEKFAVLDKAHERTRADLNHAFDKIRCLSGDSYYDRNSERE